MYLCLYNPITKETRNEIEELDPIRFPFTRESYKLQYQLEPEWQVYCEDKPFSWPIDKPS